MMPLDSSFVIKDASFPLMIFNFKGACMQVKHVLELFTEIFVHLGRIPFENFQEEEYLE